MRLFALGFFAGVVTAALLFTIALLRELRTTEQQSSRDPGPIEPYDPADEAGA